MSRPHDFRLYHGNDLTLLAAVLAAELARALPDAPLLAPDTVLIPQPAMRRWLQQTLAQRHGVAANLRFLTPGEFVREALGANLEDGGDAALAQAATLRWRAWEALNDAELLRTPAFDPVRAALAADTRAPWALAGEIAAAFEKYQAWRRDWLQAWDRGAEAQDWQAQLWRRISRGQPHRAARIDLYLRRFGPAGREVPRGLPARVFAFACQNVSPDVLRVIASAAHAGTLHFFFVSPVEGWWGDLRLAHERLREDLAGTFAADEETPLLRANGAAGRDFVRLLFGDDSIHPGFELPLYVPPDPVHRGGLLHRLQRDLLARRAPPDAAARTRLPRFDAAARADRSLQFHACATPLREVQVLHDQLRALLEADATLEPRDIAVLAPDIEAYAPAVHAVFGAPEAGLAALPYAIADVGAGAGSPLPGLLLRLFELPRARLSANEVLDLLALPAVAQRFGLEPVALALLREWVEAAGARWGLDAAHRRELGEPDEAAYTWVWAMERLLLGHAIGEEARIEGVAVLPSIEGQSLLVLDALLQFLRLLLRLRRELAQSRDASAWQAWFAATLEALLPSEPELESDRRALEWLRGLGERLRREHEIAQVQAAVPAEVLRDWLSALMAEGDARQPFLTGGITFARMVPMRLIPFRVICVLGLSDAAFPRRDPDGGINRIEAALGGRGRRRGDRSLRDDDRALFLQLFAAAGEVFYLSWIGIDPRSGEPLPPSVVVAELVDVAADAFSEPDPARDALVVKHPLQPFDPAAFGQGDERRGSFAAAWRVESLHLQPATREPPFATALTPPSWPETIDLETLRRVLARPCAAYLRDGLGLRLDRGPARLPDTEPFACDDALHRHALQRQVFDALVAASDTGPEALASQLLASAAIAPGAGGVRTVAQLRGELQAACGIWREWRVGAPGVRSCTVTLGLVQLHASLAPVHAVGLLQVRAGRAHGRARLALGLERLLWSASGETRPIHRLLLEEKAEVLPALPAERAREALADLLDLAAEARRSALPLMPDSAWVYASARARGLDHGGAFARAAKRWREREGRDPAVRLALRGADPFLDETSQAAARFAALSQRLFALLGESGDADDDD